MSSGLVHNPLGWVMIGSGREELVALARRHGLLLIEDAPNAFLAKNLPPPLAALVRKLEFIGWESGY